MQARDGVAAAAVGEGDLLKALLCQSEGPHLAGVADAGYSGASLERPGMDRLIEQEAAWRADGPDRESEILLGKVSECVRLRAAYQDQQASGLMTMEELAAKVEELEHAKELAQTELANLSERRRRVEELIRDKEAVLELRSEAVLRGLDNRSPDEKSEVYKLLKLEVTPTPEGMEVSGALLSRNLCRSKGHPDSHLSARRRAASPSTSRRRQRRRCPSTTHRSASCPCSRSLIGRPRTGRSRGVWCLQG
jgi:hypothetical protein